MTNKTAIEALEDLVGYACRGGDVDDISANEKIIIDALSREAELRVDRNAWKSTAETFEDFYRKTEAERDAAIHRENLSDKHIVEGLEREAALREELAKFKDGCVDLSSQVRELEHKMDYYKGEGLRADALQQRLTVAEQALKFYADGDHLLLADADAWDTCSGEPINFLHDEAGTASVEDGSIAKAALKPAAEPGHICKGCGAKGWTANCAQCVPY